MAHYDYNKDTYKVVTLRINRNTDADIIEKLEEQKSINAYLLNLVRKDMSMHASAEYEVIEIVQNQNHVVATFHTLAEAHEFLEYYAAKFPGAGYPVRIVRKFNAMLANGTKVVAGEIIKQNEETEENRNA